jgi:hypothetical protein
MGVRRRVRPPPITIEKLSLNLPGGSARLADAARLWTLPPLSLRHLPAIASMPNASMRQLSQAVVRGDGAGKPGLWKLNCNRHCTIHANGRNDVKASKGVRRTDASRFFRQTGHSKRRRVARK